MEPWTSTGHKLNPNLPPTIAYYFEGKGAATRYKNGGSSESGSLDWSIVSKEPASKERTEHYTIVHLPTDYSFQQAIH
jgi:hypothetical protein